MNIPRLEDLVGLRVEANHQLLLSKVLSWYLPWHHFELYPHCRGVVMNELVDAWRAQGWEIYPFDQSPEAGVQTPFVVMRFLKEKTIEEVLGGRYEIVNDVVFRAGGMRDKNGLPIPPQLVPQRLVTSLDDLHNTQLQTLVDATTGVCSHCGSNEICGC